MVTRLETAHEAAHTFPVFLPDGQHFLYYVRGAPDARGIWGEDERVFSAWDGMTIDLGADGITLATAPG